MSSLINIEKKYVVDMPDFWIRVILTYSGDEIVIKYINKHDGQYMALSAGLLREVEQYRKIAWYECFETSLEVSYTTKIFNATASLLESIVNEESDVLNIFN